MKRLKSKKLALAGLTLATCLCTGFAPVSAMESLRAPAISKSKTATQLNVDFRSSIRLSMPADETYLESDVVFVLDKSTSTLVEDEALEMLKDLQTRIVNSDAKINVGVVIFNKFANTDGKLHDLATEYDLIEAKIREKISSGTNTDAGMIAGKKLLDSGKAEDSRKYLVFVSDGLTYMYGEEPTVTAWGANQNDDPMRAFAGPENWETKFGNTNGLSDEEWDAHFAGVAEHIDDERYEYAYGALDESGQPLWRSIPEEKWSDPAKYKELPSSVDIALYNTKTTYDSVCETSHCYAINANPKEGISLAWGPSFMEYLAGGEAVDFDEIRNDIIYLVDSGSVVDDYMGYGVDNLGAEYDFDFVNEIENIKVKVGDREYAAVKITDNKYGFAPGLLVPDSEGGFEKVDYGYVLEYFPESEAGGEHIEFSIFAPVEVSAPLSLNYQVELTNPSDIEGVHGEFDPDGSEAVDAGLFTNDYAVLNYVSTDGATGKEYFARPSVSYTVEKEEPGQGGGEEAPDETPDEEPAEKPEEKPAEKPAETPKQEIVENPNTGDDIENKMVAFILAAFGAVVSSTYIALSSFKKEQLREAKEGDIEKKKSA